MRQIDLLLCVMDQWIMRDARNASPNAWNSELLH